MKVFLSLLSLIFIISGPVFADGISHDSTSVFSKIDLSSFANSLGPRHLPSGTTVKDLGWITKDTSQNSTTYISRDGRWLYNIKLIQVDKEHLVICFTDQGLKDAHYLSSQIERLHTKKTEGGKSLYVADSFRSNESCTGPNV
ncbi:hypothetical protein JK207_15355 [Gluconobacter cerinus]|nr:hypothetical protein [Gluconobacter cerinus]